MTKHEYIATAGLLLFFVGLSFWVGAYHGPVVGISVSVTIVSIGLFIGGLAVSAEEEKVKERLLCELRREGRLIEPTETD